MNIDQSRKVRGYINLTIRPYLKSNGLDADTLNNKASIQLYAKLKFNITTLKSIDNCFNWVLKTIQSQGYSRIKHQKKLKKIKSKLIKKIDRKEYQKFLKSPYWKRVRKSILLRDGNKCVKCGDKNLLHIHHTTYINHGNEHEHLDDLITLCEACHSYEHNPNKITIKEKQYA